MKKKVYVALSADILHEGHINILKKASKLGKVTVGLLTDKAIAEYKKLPVLNFNQRKQVIKSLKFVNYIIPQDTMDYRPNLLKLRPDYVIHGDYWKKGVLKKSREQVLKTIKKWSGKLIEPKYTKTISSSLIKQRLKILPDIRDNRVAILNRLLQAKKFIRIIESHSALVGNIIENLRINGKMNTVEEFDGFWSSSLAESLIRGKPDNESVSLETRITALSDLADTTFKPIIFDADNGGRLEHIPYLISSLERQGVSAVVMEDKIGLKRNSLFADQSKTKQDSIQNFSKKIKIASEAKRYKDFLIVARIESLIIGTGVNDALKRAISYSRNGADLILIHSKDKTPHKIFKFAKMFKKSKYFKPLIAVPSSYSKTHEKDLKKNNIQVVIYANQLLRSSHLSITKTALSILKNKRSFEAEKNISSVNEIINLK